MSSTQHLFKSVPVILMAILGLNSCTPSNTAKETRPNIIYILADDLGYGELGAYGQLKIETPNIDALAASGMKFTQHYSSAPVCAPARYMLLTGQHSGHAFIRGNDEMRSRGKVWDYHEMVKDSTLEGQRPMPENTKTLAHYLKSAGYQTAMVGKWGLGSPDSHSVPTKMGFDYFYGYNCQRIAHTFYPTHLYENLNRVYLNNEAIAPHTKLEEGADPYDEKSYSNFKLNDFAPDLMYDKMSAFVEEASTEEPFFLYWASPIPHNPLQAPQRWVDHYIQKFGEEEPYLGDKGYFPNQTPRATYAAMISYFDENVGRLVQKLKEKGVYENTLILFSSDNGVTFSGGTDGAFFNSSGPFGEERGRGKGFVYEGGIRVPMIASWPNKISAGSETDHISIQYDLLATLADLTSFEITSEQDGISFLPTLLGQDDQKQHDYLYWEFPEYGGQLALRFGDYKFVWAHLKDKLPPSLELYNLKEDPAEENNIAEQHPQLIEQADAYFRQAHQRSEIERFQIPLLEEGFLKAN